jgi:hypothetical protein
MKRHIPGLHSRRQDGDSPLEGLFLVRVDASSYRWHPQKPFLSVRFVVVEPDRFEDEHSRVGCTVPNEHCGS